MSDELTPNISTSSLNNIVDERIRPHHVADEEYTKGDEGNRIAIKHTPLSDTEATSNRSWALAEIERTVAAEVLPVGRQKIAQFGGSLARSNDFRLRDIARRLDRLNRVEFPAERPLDQQKTNDYQPQSQALRHVSNFEIRAHSFRQIATNATLASYQFQRTAVLPYMRKSLALDFQKTSLLKKVVGAIGGLEKSTVAKLEAIKMNTAAAAPTKVGLFTRLRNAVRDKQIDRVAGNIANRIMDRHSKTWKTMIQPLFTKLNKLVQVEGPQGGANLVGRKVTSRLNRVRHRLRETAMAEPDPANPMGKMTRTGAKIGAGALSKVVGFGQRFKLSPGWNTVATKPLANFAEFMDGFNPFSGGELDKNDIDDLEDAVKKGSTNPASSQQLGGIAKLLRDWRKDTATRHHELIEHVDGVRDRMGLPSPDKTESITRRVTAPVATPSVPKVKRPTPVVTPPKKVGIGSRFVGSIKGAAQSTVSTVGRFFKPTTKARDIPAITSLSGAGAWSTPAATMVTSAITSGQSVQTDLLGQLTAQMASVDATIKAGNDARALYEANQLKRQKLADTMANRLKVRSNSYEDKMARRGTKTSLANGDQLKATAAAVAAETERSTRDHDDDGEDDDKKSFWDTTSDLLDGEDEADGRSGRKRGRFRRFRRGRAGARARLRRMRTGGRGLFRRGFSALGRGAAGAGTGAGRGAWGAVKGLTKLGGRGLAGTARLGGRGLLAMGRSGLVRGVGVGMLAGVAGSALENSDAPDEVKRAGGTLASMASYGSMGAGIGSIIPGLGTFAGGAIGAALGGVVANADKVSDAFNTISSGAYAASKGMWSFIFGQKAKVDMNGNLVQQEKTSLLGDVKAAFFGRDAKYLPDGQMYAAGRGNLLSNIQYGFEKTFFGDRFSNGEFKEGTSLLTMARDSLKSSLEEFKKQLINAPHDMLEGVKNGPLANGIRWGAGKISAGASGAKRMVSDYTNPDPKNNEKMPLNTMSLALSAAQAWQDYSWKDTQSAFNDSFGNVSPSTLMKFADYLSPTGFAMGLSNAVYGWWTQSDEFNDPATPQYKYVDMVLNAYGIKNRTLFKYLHSLEISQEKINNQQAKPFDDKDMEYMAGRFGFDSKSADAVNYFKLWYKKRFLPALVIIIKSLQSRHLTLSSVMGASDKELNALLDVLKKDITGSGILTAGLEPTVAAYNKWAKKGTEDPGGVAQQAANKDKPYDPRDPSSRVDTATGTGYNPGNKPDSESSGSGYYGSQGEGADGGPPAPPPVARRKKAQMVKGSVTDQPEFKAAYAKLPSNIQKILRGSRPLRFILWASAVQHGPDAAALIFERDYSENLDESAYMRSIYQDRSQQFGALSSEDRAAAQQHLGQERQFAQGIQNGTANWSVKNVSSIVSDVYDPNGGYSSGGPDRRKKGRLPITPSVKQTVEWAAQQLGVAPVELAGLMSYETGGSFNPGKTGGAGGNYQGLFQYGPAERKKYGVSNQSSSEEQIRAFVKFATDRGYKPGMGWQQLYTTINAGAPVGTKTKRGVVSVNWSDGNKTQTGHYAEIRANHFDNAIRWLQGAGGNQATSPAGAATVAKAAAPKPKAPEAKSQTPRAAPAAPAKPKAKPKAPEYSPAQIQKAWHDGLSKNISEMTMAIHENTKTMKGQGPLKDTPSNNAVVAPLILKDGASTPNFAALSMKKSQMAFGK
jgi:hypothetical protein